MQRPLNSRLDSSHSPNPSKSIPSLPTQDLNITVNTVYALTISSFRTKFEINGALIGCIHGQLANITILESYTYFAEYPRDLAVETQDRPVLDRRTCCSLNLIWVWLLNTPLCHQE